MFTKIRDILYGPLTWTPNQSTGSIRDVSKLILHLEIPGSPFEKGHPQKETRFVVNPLIKYFAVVVLGGGGGVPLQED